MGRQPVQEDGVLVEGPANLINQFAKELTTEKQNRDADLPLR